MSERVRELRVKTGLFSSVTVLARINEFGSSVDLVEPVTIRGVRITECHGFDGDPEHPDATRRFKQELLVQAGVSNNEAYDWSMKYGTTFPY